MKNKKFVTVISIVLGFIVFIGIAIITNLFSGADLPVQISGALLEAVVTALITYFLLTGQTSQEEIKERQVKVFEKKQEVYHNFLEKLKEIVQDGEITITSKDDKHVDELKDLIFQLAYLKMHTNENEEANKDNVQNIFKGVATLIKVMNEFNSETTSKEELASFYAEFTKELFQIISILKRDLYGAKTNPFDEKEIKDILQMSNFVVEQNISDKHDIQKYFWDELQKQLIKKGYKIQHKDFSSDIDSYYARARDRYRYYGISFEIYKSKQTQQLVMFDVLIENGYYYGFKKDSNQNVQAELLEKCIDYQSFKQDEYWWGWKYPSDRFALDFWNLNSSGFEVLKTRKRRSLIQGIADEMDRYIKEFIESAEKNNL